MLTFYTGSLHCANFENEISCSEVVYTSNFRRTQRSGFCTFREYFEWKYLWCMYLDLICRLFQYFRSSSLSSVLPVSFVIVAFIILSNCSHGFLAKTCKLWKFQEVFCETQCKIGCRWFLPRCMKCRHGLAMRILSVHLSVKRVDCDKWN